MNLRKIISTIEEFKAALDNKWKYEHLFKWESQKYFQENWNEDVLDFKTMFDNCLQNNTSRRLWIGENYAPKEMMLKFIDLQADFVEYMFRDLFNETKATDNRVDRFLFHCDELLVEYKTANPSSIENSHYHTTETVFLYLALRYPESYGLYDFNIFCKTLEILGAKNIPKVHDVQRYVKTTKTLYKFISKDETLLQKHQKRLNVTKHYTKSSLLLVDDYCRYTCQYSK